MLKAFVFTIKWHPAFLYLQGWVSVLFVKKCVDGRDSFLHIPHKQNYTNKGTMTNCLCHYRMNIVSAFKYWSYKKHGLKTLYDTLDQQLGNKWHTLKLRLKKKKRNVHATMVAQQVDTISLKHLTTPERQVEQDVVNAAVISSPRWTLTWNDASIRKRKHADKAWWKSMVCITKIHAFTSQCSN